MRENFRRVLVANRGEIAIRVMRALRDLGIESVAVYSEADQKAPHVRFADHSVAIGPAPSKESYLAIDRIIDAAKRIGADAIHPGYGFLSENEDFAAACDRAGIIFIGPTAESIAAIGDKGAARKIAEGAGVPTTPGFVGLIDDAALEKAARSIGLPILLKPSGGGGGKGMKVVERFEDLLPFAVSARREAERAFGNSELIVEKYVKPARHVEIQVFGDGRGKVIALGERECSLQRRHQKVVEECPSPVVSESLRTAMCASAVKLASAVHYRGAGTVEFLLGPDEKFYFLEMNTRLQVEHPVTELVYGVDLVRAQIAVARGAEIPDELIAARRRGHAIEVRLYAEDPANGFLPCPGPVHLVREPAGPGIRVDGALENGGTVASYYDPMLAKICAYGATRDEACRRLARALEETVCLGVTTNLDFLSWIVGRDWFFAGKFSTSTIGEIERDFQRDAVDAEIPAVVLAAALTAQKPGGSEKRADATNVSVGADPFTDLGAWRQSAKGQSR